MSEDTEKLERYFKKLEKEKFDGEVLVKMERGEIQTVVVTRYLHVASMK